MKSKTKALIVDDEPDLLELIAITLERMDIETVLAGDLQTAKDQLKQSEFHFCLTDLKLPDGNGIDLVITSILVLYSRKTGFSVEGIADFIVITKTQESTG